MNLSKLIMTATSEDKLDEKETLKMLACEIEKGTEPEELYEKIYKKAYGDTISRDLAEDVVKGFSITDGSERMNGEKWTMDQTTAVGSEIAIDFNKVPKINWYIVLNMMYSDFYNTAKKVEYEDDPKFYAYLAKDWLWDMDAPADKLFKYIFHVIK